MAETIWNSAVSVYHFMMDNLVVINFAFSGHCVFSEKISADGMDLAVIAVFYTDSRICPVSADRAGFS